MLTELFALAALTTTLAASDPRADLEARATALGLPNAARIAADALPGARMVAGGNAAGASRLGGNPDLPPGTKWPTCRGKRMSFLAQIPLADIAAVSPGTVPAGGGTLSVFAGLIPDDSGVTRMEQGWGRVGRATCVTVRELRGTLVRRTTPKRVPRLRSRPVRLQPTLTVLDWELAQERYELTDEQIDDAYWKLQREAATGTLGGAPDDGPVHQLLGWPAAVQFPPLFGCAQLPSAERITHRLLLQLDFDDALRFAIGDGGVLYLTGRPADLRAGRFNRLCSDFQQG